MKTLKKILLTFLLIGILVPPVIADKKSPGYNLLRNAGFMSVKSGYWPDWWNWYNALGDPRYNLHEILQLVDEHHIPGTHSMKLSKGAQLQTSYLRIFFSKGIPITFSAYLKSDSPETKVNMYIYQDGWNQINEVKEVTVGTEWKRYYVTTIPQKKSRGGRNVVRVGLSGPGTLWVNAPQLEEGSTPTKWKLSLKDMPKKQEAAEVKQADPKFAIPRIDCLKIDKAPVIDGILNDAAWKKASATKRFMRLDTDLPANVPTDAYICRDNEAVYIAFRCHEPEMGKLTAKATLRDALSIFRDDSVEVFISGNEDGSDYLRFAANSRGTKLDSKGGKNKFFDTEWECATSKGKNFWSVEFRLPFSSLERPLQPGTPWRINFCRYRARPKTEEYSVWAPVVRTFHDPDHFGIALGMITEISAFGKKDTAKDKLIAYLDRSFYTTESEANVFVDAPQGTKVRFTMKGSERKEKVLPFSRLIVIDLSQLATGKHPIQITVGKRKTDITLVKLAPKENAVKIDRINRIYLVDGKPFLPFGSMNYTDKTLKLQSELGLNWAYVLVHGDFDRKAQDRVRRVLDIAHALGMKITLWYGNYKFINDNAKWQAEVLEIIEMFKDHPAILEWWVYDEPVTNIKWLKGLCESVNKADPYHPVFVEWCDRGHGFTDSMAEVSGDVYAMHLYAINARDQYPHEAFLSISNLCDQMTAIAKKTGAPVSFMNGIIGWATHIRECSPIENRFITYVALIQGARMLRYYNTSFLSIANPALRESFKPLSREIKTLTSIVANPEVKERVSCDNPRIAYTAFQTPKGLYIIAINTDDNDEKVTFRIKGAKGKVKVLFEDRKRKLRRGGVLKDAFKPLERHVYHIESVLSR
ncbi:MAG: carbohydrate binding family 9 domain-containing protein [Victivallaceae bacterium]|nr:carbohydrate binding family 9 domain-containing protein [Victivallaceae bacterium]